MMMPANFSAIAENEMTYVNGGAIADYLAPVMTAANWQTFNTNVITIIGNSFVSGLVKATLGEIFGGNYAPGNVTKSIAGSLTDVYMKNAYGLDYAENVDVLFGRPTLAETANAFLNVGLQIVGGMAAVYTMGNGSVKAGILSKIEI